MNSWQISHMTDAVAISILDLPASFAADTVVLPFTIYEQIRYGDVCKNNQPNQPNQPKKNKEIQISPIDK